MSQSRFDRKAYIGDLTKKARGVYGMKRMVFIAPLVIFLILPNIDGLSGQEKPRILFDDYHAKWKPSKHLMDFQSELEKEGYNVGYSEDRIDPSLLEEYDVFVVFIPSKYYHDNERNAITRFVENGGGLIIFGEHGQYLDIAASNSLNKVSTMFGIRFNADVVLDSEKNREGEDCHPIISNFKRHPVTKGVKSIGYICGCSLTLESSATTLAFGNLSTTTTADKQKGKDIVVLAVAESGKGRIVAVGDQDFLVGPNSPRYEEDFLSFMDNKKLALNMFEWVAQPSIRPPDTAEADELASEGHRLFSQRVYSQAKLQFEKAKKLYLEANMTEKVSEMQEMITKCDKGLDAEVAYQEGMEYYSKKEYDNAITEFQRSKSLYDEIEDSTGSQQAQPMIDECEKAKNAEAAYEKGREYYEQKEYDNAITEFQRSKSLYDEIEDSTGSQQAQSMIDECEKAKNAEAAYEKGREYYSKSKYEDAITEFEKAISLYKELGYTGKTEELRAKIEEAQKAISERVARNRVLVIVGIFVVIVVAFLVVYIFVRERGVPEGSDILHPEKVYCSSCGKENVKGTSYCKHCKAPLKSLDELEKEKILEDVRKKFVSGEISEEEYHRIMNELKESL